MRTKHALGKHRRRLILCRQSLAAKNDAGEEVESWPDPTWGTNEFWASIDTLTAGETIVQGLRQTNTGFRFRMTRKFPGRAVDRLRDKLTGTLYAITGVAVEDEEAVVTVENVGGDPGVLLSEDGTPLRAEDGSFILCEV